MNTTNHRRLGAAILAEVLLAAAALGGCGGKPLSESPARGAVVTTVATFAGGTPSGDVVLPARVKAAEEVTLVARVSARLTSVVAREGKSVRAGDPIAVFAAPEMKRALAAARADVAATELSLAVAARQEARAESLFANHVVAEREREVVAAERRSAEARLEAARAALDALASGSTVRAPFEGVVVRVHADPGADLAAGAPIADLRSSEGLEVVCEVPEAEAPRLAGATLAVQIGDGPWHPSKLLRFEGMTDWRSRSRTAHLSYEGPAEPGAYARVALTAAATDPLRGTVPSASLVSRGALSGVFVVEGGTAQLRWLKLGRARGDRVEVLAGLEPGETYALEPGTLADGAAVEVRP